MSFEKVDFSITKEVKAFKFVMDYLHCSMREAQRHIDKQRLFCEGKVVSRKSLMIKGDISLVRFIPNTKGLKPIFQSNDFALFDKPSGLLVHPKNRKTFYSLTDEVKYLFGNDANIVHRIDKETSGLVLVAKHRKAEIFFKNAFQNKEIKKGYIALVKGKIDKELFIDEPIKINRDYSKIKIKVFIDETGKKAQTIVKPLYYNEENNTTLVEALPLTGRQHQIRIHLFHMKHSILGDPIYGTDFKTASDYLGGKLSENERIELTGAKRLMLHANWIEFRYKNRFKIFTREVFGS
jgi:23S rRNA pseudouridine1911/1915/1917 synthase